MLLSVRSLGVAPRGLSLRLAQRRRPTVPPRVRLPCARVHPLSCVLSSFSSLSLLHVVGDAAELSDHSAHAQPQCAAAHRRNDAAQRGLCSSRFGCVVVVCRCVRCCCRSCCDLTRARAARVGVVGRVLLVPLVRRARSSLSPGIDQLPFPSATSPHTAHSTGMRRAEHTQAATSGPQRCGHNGVRRPAHCPCSRVLSVAVCCALSPTAGGPSPPCRRSAHHAHAPTATHACITTVASCLERVASFSR